MEQRFSIPVSVDEVEVASVLLELPHLIFESESRPRFSFTWGFKRKRSTASKEPVAATSSPSLKLSSPPPPPPPPSLPPSLPYKVEEPKEKVLTSSPSTPLSFYPSESDEKPLRLPPKIKVSGNSILRKKQQLQELENDYKLSNELLRREIENKKRFLNQNKAENLELKAKKHKLSRSLGKQEEPCLETGQSLNLGIQFAQISAETETSTSQEYLPHHRRQRSVFSREYQQPLIMDQAVYKSEINHNNSSQYPIMITWLPSSNGGGLSKLHDNSNEGPPLRLFDLNVSAEEALPVKLIDEPTAAKVRAADARLKRRQIRRLSKINNNNAAAFRACPLR